MKYSYASCGGELLQMLMGMVDNYLVASLGLITISGDISGQTILLLFIKQFYRFRAAISSLISKTLAQETRKI